MRASCVLDCAVEEEEEEPFVPAVAVPAAVEEPDRLRFEAGRPAYAVRGAVSTSEDLAVRAI